MVYPPPCRRGQRAFLTADFTTVLRLKLSNFHLQESPEEHFSAYLAHFSITSKSGSNERWSFLREWFGESRVDRLAESVLTRLLTRVECAVASHSRVCFA